MIYTTYLSKLKNIPDNAIKVCISRHVNKEVLEKYNCIHALSLAPSSWLLSKYKLHGNFDKFEKDFRKEKSKATKKEHEETTKILNLCRTNDVYFICYELDHTKCHRSIVASQISNKLNIPWEEAKL